MGIDLGPQTHSSRSRFRAALATARGRAGKPWLTAAATAAALTLAACGGDENGEDDAEAGGGDTPAEVFDRFNAMSGQERHDALVEAAKAEGSIVFYSPLAEMGSVAEAFEEEYDITVDFYSAQSDTVLQRLMQEAEAGHHGVDVFDDSEAYTVAQEGLTYEYVNPDVTDGLPGFDPDLHVVPTRLAVYTQAWNTDQVTEDEIPDMLDGFADPTWDGRLSLDPRDWIWYTGVLDYYTEQEGWSEDEVDELMSTLASYSTYNEGHTVNAELLLAGEFPATLSVYTDSIESKVRTNPEVPIAWRKSDGSYIKPLVFQPQGAVLMKNAPHPAAATLFIDFMLTEGQRVLSDEYGIATSVVQPGGPLEGVAEEDLVEVDFEKFTAGREEWSSRFNELLQRN